MEGADAGPQEPGNHGNRDVHRLVKRCSEISAKGYSDQDCVAGEKEGASSSSFFFSFLFFNELARQREAYVYVSHNSLGEK